MADHDYLWDPSAPPDPEIARLEEALRPLRFEPAAAPEIRLAPRRRLVVPLAAAAAIAAAALVTLRPSDAAPWTVTRLGGEVLAGGSEVTGRSGALRPGEWVETGAAGSARIRVGRIGEAELGPGSRASLVRAAGTEHRMALQHGTLHARISAPPRFFLVETPGALAVDLGCVYTLSVDPAGSGMLHVESGQVELVAGERRVVVPAGNQAPIRRGAGPGLPYPDDAGPALLAAAARYDAGDPAGFAAVMAAADSSGTITLWHLMQRETPERRRLIDARLRQLATPPPDVRLHDPMDARALGAWYWALQGAWTRPDDGWWSRAWRWVSG